MVAAEQFAGEFEGVVAGEEFPAVEFELGSGAVSKAFEELSVGEGGLPERFVFAGVERISDASGRLSDVGFLVAETFFDEGASSFTGDATEAFDGAFAHGGRGVGVNVDEEFEDAIDILGVRHGEDGFEGCGSKFAVPRSIAMLSKEVGQRREGSV